MIAPLAADYPFLDVLWSMLIFMAFVLWISLAIQCFADIFRRRDAGGVTKALWIVAVIVLPYLGVLLYLITNHTGMAERSAKNMALAQDAFDERVREAAGSKGPAGEIETARKLLENGTIDQAEFDRLKANALST